MKRHGYIIGGQVQGVGFRPFVYRAATRLRLTGHVGNTSDGVRVEVQGTDEALAAFAHALEHELPPLARITSLRREELPLADGEAAFAIAHSEGHHGHAVLVSPDVATCGNCLADMRDPANRRYRYPFTNCTDCGPRYTITHSIPYDRATTSMSCFPLCPDCAAEYNDPLDRRFHAQPNACPVCGPKVWLASAPEGDPRIPGPELAEGQRAIERTAAALRAGNIVAVKGLGGFHLVCDATSAEAIALLRERKCRPHKSLAIMVPDLETARRVACVSDAEAAVLASSERPIVVLASRGVLPPAIAPDVGSIGVMLPYTPLQHLLLHDFGAFVGIPDAQNIQIVFRFVELVTGFHEPCVNRRVRRLRRIPHLPVPQYTGVIRQNRKAQPLVFHELLCFCSDMLCVDRCCAGRLVRAEMKICHQLPCRIIRR